MTTIPEAMAARYPEYNYDEHLFLFQNDGNGVIIRSDLWPSGWGDCPTIETVLGWLNE